MVDPDLHAAYSRTEVTITLDNGALVTQHPGAAAHPCLLPLLPCHVISAWNPESGELSAEENASRHAHLHAALNDRGAGCLDAVGTDPQRDWSEESLAVAGLSRAEAIEIGREFRQNAIFELTERGLEVVYCELDPRSERAPVIAFSVLKFAPSRCPACEREFRNDDDFSIWAGRGPAESFVEAQALQMKRYPELFVASGSQGDDSAIENPYRASFIRCSHCENKTLTFSIEERTVATIEQARKLVDASAFTCIREVELMGTTVEEVQALERLVRTRSKP